MGLAPVRRSFSQGNHSWIWGGRPMFQRNFIKNLDWTFIGLILLIMLTSLIILSSASANIYAKHPYYFLKKQLIWIFIGFIAMVVIASLNYSFLIKASNLIYAVNIVLLILVLVLGSDAKGAQRWISIGGFDFQPSEFAKIAIIITFANVLTKRQGGLNKFRDFLPCFAHIGIPMLLILKQPDLGTSLVFMAIMMGMLWVSGANPKILWTIIGVGAVLALFIFSVLFIATAGFQKVPEELPIPLPLKLYQLMRLIIFINPNMDPLGFGYHVIQSKVAIGSGGILGKGLGNGSQVQGNFLPEHHTDFVFSVVGEELGFIGSAIVLLIFFFLLNKIIKIAGESKDMFGTLLVIGVVSMLSFHILINIGMTTGIMPVTGIPLPFLSYGGSGMLTNMISMGLVLNVSLHKQKLMF
jgi:rod shape determining protein RodA